MAVTDTSFLGVSGDGVEAELPTLTVVCRSLLLLAGEGMSLGLAAWSLRIGDALPAYVAANVLPEAARRYVLLDLLGGAIAGLAIGAVLLLVLRRRGGVQTVSRLALRLGPLLVAWMLPALFNWSLWAGRDLEFLTLAATLGLVLQPLVRRALLTAPAFPSRRPPTWLARIGSLVATPFRWSGAPFIAVCLGAAGYAAFFAFHTVRNHYRLGTASLDLGLEDNLVWNAAHWGPLFKSSPLGGPKVSHGGYHQTYFAYVLGLAFRLAPRPQTLLVIQAIFAGAAAFPLYFLGRRRLSSWAGAIIALLYLLYAPLHGANLYDFHYLLLAPFFLWGALNFVEAGKNVWAALAVLCALSVREDVAALLAFIGGYLLLQGNRPRAGVILAAVGGGYFVALKLLVMPRFLAGNEAFIEMFRELLPAGDRGYGGVLETAIGNPAFTLGKVLERDKLVYVLAILAPFSFLPWRRPIGALCIVPGFLFTMLSTKYAPLIQPTFQYTTYWTVFLFLGSITNLGWMAEQERIRPGEAAPFRASRHAWMTAFVTTMLATSHQFGAVLQQHTARGGFGQFRFDLTKADHERHQRLYALLARVPPKAKIVSSENLVPHDCDRPDSYTMRNGIADAQYLLAWMPPRGDERTSIAAAIKNGTFGVIEERGEFVLAERGYPTGLNAGVAKKYGF